MNAKEIYNFLDKIYNFKSQAEWDYSTCHIHSQDPVDNILICLDINQNVLNIAIENDVQLIISHHPMFIEPANNENYHTRKLLGKLKNSNISAIFLHTPFDKSLYGMNVALAYKLGLKEINRLQDGYTVKGIIPPIKFAKFAKLVKNTLNSDYANYLTRYKDTIVEKVAICGGSASANIFNLINEDLDVYITCDMKHHAWIDSVELKIPVLDLNHNIENIFIDIIIEKILQILPECKFLKVKSALNVERII